MDDLPPQYERLHNFVLYELGQTFTDTKDNVGLIAGHMGWSPSQVRSILGILSHRGFFKWSRQNRTWTVVAKAA